MNFSRTTETYIEFLKINEDSYGDKIRFFERNRQIISSLPDDENLELNLYYLIALFEAGEHKKFLQKVDPLIEYIVSENIFQFNEQDIYYKLLLYKASAHYNLFNNEKAQKIAEQLYKINKEDKLNKLLLQKIYIRMLSEKRRSIKALGIALYFLAGVVIAFQLLLIEPFYYQYNKIAQNTWQGIFVFACVILIINELNNRYKAFSKAKQITS